eukprot:scaffold324_cov394-Prasinococcus_capsulatus_cf.AAC.31
MSRARLALPPLSDHRAPPVASPVLRGPPRLPSLAHTRPAALAERSIHPRARQASITRRWPAAHSHPGPGGAPATARAYTGEPWTAEAWGLRTPGCGQELLPGAEGGRVDWPKTRRLRHWAPNYGPLLRLAAEPRHTSEACSRG